VPNIRDAGVPNIRDAGVPSIRDAGKRGNLDTRPVTNDAAPTLDARAEVRISAAGWILLDNKRVKRDQLRTRITVGEHVIAVKLDDDRVRSTSIDAREGDLFRCQLVGDALVCRK
jgi:hypothetical protein